MKTAPDADRRTRDRVAGLLLEAGPSTAAALGVRVGLTTAAVRRHLDAMVADGTAVERQPRGHAPRGRGRPARVFALSDSGHAALNNGYDDIAAAALRWIAAKGGHDAVTEFAEARVADLERSYGGRLAGVVAAERPAVLAEALTSDGYAASAQRAGAGMQICQHHCPVQHIAEQFPHLCDAETAAFSRLLGSHVQRLATIAHGDGVCTTYVPPSAGKGRP